MAVEALAAAVLTFYIWLEYHEIVLKYSGIPPYGHLGNTVTSLLQPLFLAARQNGHTFSCKKKPSLIRSPVNTTKFFWPIGNRINVVPLY